MTAIGRRTGRGARQMAARGLVLACLAGVVAEGASSATPGMGIATKFVEVLVEGVPVGSRHVVEAKLVDVINNSDAAQRMRFDPLEPLAGEMRAGYEPIPDPAWLSFEPRTVEAPARGSAAVKAVLYLPDDPALVGRRFQAMIWIRPAEPPAGGLAAALKTRLLFSIAAKGAAPGRATVTDFPKKLAVLTPYETVGKAGELVAVCKPLKAENPHDVPMTYEVVTEAPGAGRRPTLTGTMAALDPAWIEVWPRTVVLPPRTKTELQVTVRIPLAPERFGRVHAALLHTVATRKGAAPVDVWNSVLVDVPAMAPAGGVK